MAQKVGKRVGMILLASVIVAAMCLIAQTETAHAGYMTWVKYAKKVSVTTLDETVVLNMGKKVNMDSKVTVKSSKPSVVSGEFQDGCVFLNIKKNGTSKLTIQNKSTKKTYTCTFKVVKYKNPFKKFKIGGKSVAKQFGHSYEGALSKPFAKGTKAKITIKPKKGWKVKKIVYRAAYYGEGSKPSVKKRVKNKSRIALRDPSCWSQELTVVMVHKKNNMKREYTLDL